MSKYGGYWCEKHEKKHTELTMGYYGCKKCSDEFDEEQAKPSESGFNVDEMNKLFKDSILKKKLDEGLQQVKDGKGITTEELKEKLRKRYETS